MRLCFTSSQIPSSTGVKGQATDGSFLNLAKSWEAELLACACLASKHHTQYEMKSLRSKHVGRAGEVA